MPAPVTNPDPIRGSPSRCRIARADGERQIRDAGAVIACNQNDADDLLAFIKS